MKRAIPFHIIIALFVLLLCLYFLASKLLDGRKLIPQRRSSRLPRRCCTIKLDIVGSRLIKLWCYQFISN